MFYLCNLSITVLLANGENHGILGRTGGISVDTRVAIISIIVENAEAVEELNALLHEYARYVIGRMGIPYHAKGINIISVAVDAPMDSINTLAGKLGRLHGVTAKAIYSAK